MPSPVTPSAAPARAGAHSFEYDAAKSTGRRRAPQTAIYAEHVVLPESKRCKLLATAQDQIRNVTLVAWMVRRHLDYVSKFLLQFRTAASETDTARVALDNQVRRLFHWHGQPRNFDIARRLGREEAFRLFELEKVVCGDAALVRLPGMRFQAVESDMIAAPRVGKWDPARKAYSPIPRRVAQEVGKDTGVILDPAAPGAVSHFCICNRGADGKQVAYDHLEAAANVIFDAYYTRLSSQVRGVSPLSAAINTIQDLYEGVDFNLAKAKVHALFGIALMRDYAASTDQQEVYGMGAAAGQTQGATESSATASETAEGTKSIAATLQEIKPSEMMLLDMDTKGRIETIESKTPSTEFQNFTQLAARLALLALDIPYTALNSSAASFAGMIADQNLYEVSCRWKREKNEWKRYEYSDAVIAQAWADPNWRIGEYATAAGFKSAFDVASEIEWIPSGFPWLQKLQEVEGDRKAISVGLDNPIDAAKRRGGDFHANVLKTEQAYTFAKAHNVPLMIGEPGQASVAEVSGEEAPEGGTDE